MTRDTPSEDLATATFEAHRDRLFGVAYRMTGSVADAHDVCQDAWLRWQRVDHATVDNAEAFLVRVVTRLAIDRATAATARREHYVGPSLPEPVVGNGDNQPEAAAELADSMTFAFLVVLDALTPIERAVFLLHDVFSYSFDEIALVVDKSAQNCRQIASRTRRKIAQRPQATASHGVDTAATIAELVELTIVGDIPQLMQKLAPGVVQIDDGGPLRRAARHPIVGRERVARFLINLAKRFTADMTVEAVTVNGTAGLLIRNHGIPDMVMTCAVDDAGLIERVYVQLNPDKLRHLS